MVLGGTILKSPYFNAGACGRKNRRNSMFVIFAGWLDANMVNFALVFQKTTKNKTFNYLI
jgi:hypothetical protein